MIDHSTPEAQALFEREVRRRMDPPFNMSRTQAEMLTAAMMWDPAKTPHLDDHINTVMWERQPPTHEDVGTGYDSGATGHELQGRKTKD